MRWGRQTRGSNRAGWAPCLAWSNFQLPWRDAKREQNLTDRAPQELGDGRVLSVVPARLRWRSGSIACAG